MILCLSSRNAPIWTHAASTCPKNSTKTVRMLLAPYFAMNGPNKTSKRLSLARAGVCSMLPISKTSQIRVCMKLRNYRQNNLTFKSFRLKMIDSSHNLVGKHATLAISGKADSPGTWKLTWPTENFLEMSHSAKISSKSSTPQKAEKMFWL